MGKRGPKSDKVLTPFEGGRNLRPKPLTGMLVREKEVWYRVVNSFPPNHFQSHHLDALRIYCQAVAECNRLAKKIRKEGETVTSSRLVKKEIVDGKTVDIYEDVVKTNPLCTVLKGHQSTVASLMVKLGLTCNTTRVKKGGVKKDNPSKRFLFGGGDDDE